MPEIINKQCPCCGEYIHVNALECEYCGEKFELQGSDNQDISDNEEPSITREKENNETSNEFNWKICLVIIISIIFLITSAFIIKKFNEVNSSIIESFDKGMMNSDTEENIESQSESWKKDLQKAKKLFKDGNYDESAKILQNIIDNNPQNAVAHYHMGEIYNEQGYTDLAIASYKKADENKRDFFEPLKRLTEVYMQKMDYDTAIQYAERAYDINQKNIDILSSLQTLYINSNNTDKVLEISKKILKINAEDYSANEILGNYYYDNERYKEAIPYYKKITATNYNTNIAYKLVNTYKNVEYYSAALNVLDTIIENDPSEYYTVNYLRREINELKEQYNYKNEPSNESY